MGNLDSTFRAARRLAKGAYWLMTPWRTSERWRFLQDRALMEKKAQDLAALFEQERARLVSPLRDEPPVLPFDPYDDADVMDSAGSDFGDIFWPPVDAASIRDAGNAARFIIDVLRSRKDLRLRFPDAFSALDGGDFGRWVASDAGRTELGVSEDGARHLVVLLASDPAARARQFFMSSTEVRAALPHGLMPAGRRSLFKWFVRHARDGASLTIEEIWWLFFQATEDPQGELCRAYLFTPEWQRLFPDGLTVFGWPSFAEWVRATYGPENLAGMSSAAPGHLRPEVQLRAAYWARPAWRAAHPDALAHAGSARAFIDWLMSGGDVELGPQARTWCSGLDAEQVSSELPNGPVNVIGHFCYPSGLRVSVEALVGAMARQGIRASLRDVRTDPRDDPRHVRFDGLETGDVTIIHVQPEPFFAEVYARADLAERVPRTYRIAYWYWEFDSVPQSWCDHAAQVDEVWVATEFIARGLRERLTIPVRTLFPGVALAPFQVRSRSYFGLPSDRYIFLFTFHMMSVMERKNPLGLIRAFQKAFRSDEPVTLVLKTSFGDRHPEQFDELLDAAAGIPAIKIIDEVYTSDEVLSLMNTCDAYVSLHRSEGLGLTMAEAMLMGKPVVATGFSGNMDFMDEDNSLLVPYEAVTVGRAIPPYEADLEWAEPSVEHAAQALRRLYDDQQGARELGARGQRSAMKRLSLEEAGKRIVGRLAEIESLRRDLGPGT